MTDGPAPETGSGASMFRQGPGNRRATVRQRGFIQSRASCGGTVRTIALTEEMQFIERILHHPAGGDLPGCWPESGDNRHGFQYRLTFENQQLKLFNVQRFNKKGAVTMLTQKEGVN